MNLGWPIYRKMNAQCGSRTIHNCARPALRTLKKNCQIFPDSKYKDIQYNIFKILSPKIYIIRLFPWPHCFPMHKLLLFVHRRFTEKFSVLYCWIFSWNWYIHSGISPYCINIVGTKCGYFWYSIFNNVPVKRSPFRMGTDLTMYFCRKNW